MSHSGKPDTDKVFTIALGLIAIAMLLLYLNKSGKVAELRNTLSTLSNE